MAFTKITAEDIANKGVVGLPDTPNLSTQAMEEKFDELALDVLMPKHNELIDELEAKTAAGNIGAIDPLGEATTIQAMLNRAAESGYTKAETDALLSNKVDREQGKGLTTNDFSDAYKYKLNNIEDNANNYVLPKATQSTLGGVMGDGVTFTVDENGKGHAIGGGGGGTADFNALVNKPVVNGVTVMGDKTSEEYGLLRPYIVVTSDAGSTVSISKGGVTIQAEQITSTTWGVYPTSYGSWTVKSELSGADDSTATVVVDTVKTYAISVNHISSTITVTYPSGASCVLSKGAIEYVATSSPQTFTVQSIGTWTVTTTLDGVVKTATVSITADGQSQSVTVEYVEIEVTYGNDFEGKTITCTDGVDTYTKTASGGKVSFFIPAYGSTWTISSEASGVPYSTQQTVTEFTKYTVVLNVFSATVTVTFPYSKGATCTLSDGNTTLTATTSPMAFNVGNTGTWVATVTLDNIVKSDSVSITTDGQTEALTIEYGEIELIFDNEFRGLSVICNSGVTNIIKTAPISGNTMYFYPPSTGEWTISSTYSGNSYSTSATVTSLSVQASAILRLRPNGATVTPTDDIQTWLQCGGIFDKSYTTLSEVLADSTTLATLIADNNAVDYLVRSTTWASGVCVDSTAMSYIGLNNYASNTLLADSDWLNAICDSAYFESVLNVKVPTMTSNTTPSGECFASPLLSSTYPAYIAFNGSATDNTVTSGSTNAYIGYKFTVPIRLKRVDYRFHGNTTETIKDYDIQGYDGSNWVTLKSGTLSATTSLQSIVDTFGNTAYSDFRIYAKNNNGGTNICYTTVQFYGRIDV